VRIIEKHNSHGKFVLVLKFAVFCQNGGLFMKKIGILALQGAFIEHQHMLERLGTECTQLRQRQDLEKSIDGLILPGGESTVMGKLLRELEMFYDLGERIREGLPVFGTCAGLILLARQIVNESDSYFGTMDITVRRNAYGRQLGSFLTEGRFGDLEAVPMTFIRAPYIDCAGEGVEILARVDGKSVAARQRNMLVTAFHPEITDHTGVHQYFLDMV
jgi:5'-phosphate synthase pdxT subunit